RRGTVPRLFFLNLPIYILAAVSYFLIRGGLGDLKIPVIIYLIVIVMMATTARERFKKTNSVSFWQVMIGAGLFMISDIILAINMFFKSFPEAGILVLGTYIIAQFLIVRGIMAHAQ
ncbi:MAG: lysoplasmalogenase, partial [Cyclobacteriaceae bacterium]|nr:lysoplasmalogenase [Cyclobacteriaceae bacterium]